jgi:hypothetical protein
MQLEYTNEGDGNLDTLSSPTLRIFFSNFAFPSTCNLRYIGLASRQSLINYVIGSTGWKTISNVND